MTAHRSPPLATDDLGARTAPMLITLRTGPRAEAQGPLAPLRECHRRIRSFIGMAMRIGASGSTPLDEIVAASAQVQRYFVEAFPLHERDEEDSLLPRLARHADARPLLDTMTADHRSLAEPIAELVLTCARVRRAPHDAEARRQLSAVAVPLAEAFARHLAMEETRLFPLAEALLDGDELTAIATEIRARRDAAFRT